MIAFLGSDYLVGERSHVGEWSPYWEVIVLLGVITLLGSNRLVGVITLLGSNRLVREWSPCLGLIALLASDYLDTEKRAGRCFAFLRAEACAPS